MVHGVFARGTTPTQIFSMPGDLKTSEFSEISIAYRQKRKLILKKTKADTKNILDLDSEKNIILVLSQSDTLKFDPNIEIVEVQIRGLSNGNDVIPLGEYRLRLEDAFDEEELV